MKVHEVIALLRLFPQDADVFVYDATRDEAEPLDQIEPSEDRDDEVFLVF